MNTGNNSDNYSLSCTQIWQVLQISRGLDLFGGFDEAPSLSKCSMSMKQAGGNRGTVLRGVRVLGAFTASPFYNRSSILRSVFKPGKHTMNQQSDVVFINFKLAESP